MKMQESKDQTIDEGKCNAARQNITQSNGFTAQDARSSALFDLSDENTCRICHLATKKKELFSHCQCKGSVGLVHSSCLLLWIKKSGSVTCEICQAKYITISQLNKVIWQWKLPRVRAKGWIKIFFFIGFLSLLIAFTSWAVWSSVSLSQEAKRQRSTKFNWLSYLICGILLLIPVVVMSAYNFRSVVNYILKCITINREITVVPKVKRELNEDQTDTENEKGHNKSKGNTQSNSKGRYCYHGLENSEAQVESYDSYVTYKDDFHGKAFRV